MDEFQGFLLYPKPQSRTSRKVVLVQKENEGGDVNVTVKIQLPQFSLGNI